MSRDYQRVFGLYWDDFSHHNPSKYLELRHSEGEFWKLTGEQNGSEISILGHRHPNPSIPQLVEYKNQVKKSAEHQTLFSQKCGDFADKIQYFVVRAHENRCTFFSDRFQTLTILFYLVSSLLHTRFRGICPTPSQTRDLAGTLLSAKIPGFS